MSLDRKFLETQMLYEELITDLEEKLAEKEKEIDELKASSDKNIDYLIEFASLIEDEKDCNKMLKALDRVKQGKKYIIDNTNQDKISFCIEQLEKVRKQFDCEDNYCYGDNNIIICVNKKIFNEEIDNQIKQLKE